MILYPHEFELYAAWIGKILNHYNKLIESGVSREDIESIKITDYSNDTGTFTKAQGIIKIKRLMVLPKGVKPHSTRSYDSSTEAYTELYYVFDVDTHAD